MLKRIGRSRRLPVAGQSGFWRHVRARICYGIDRVFEREDENLEGKYEHLVESLRLLAADAEDQLTLLPDFVVPTDEVASEFDNAFLLLPQLEESAIAGENASNVIRQVDSLLDEMPTESEEPLSDPSTELRNSEFWSRARAAARGALLALDEEVTLPKLHHIAWANAQRGSSA